MQDTNGYSEIFGDPKDFAIEAGIDSLAIPSKSVWGHMRVWCSGMPLGDIDNRCCALYPSYKEFQQVICRADNLWDDALSGLNDEDAWNFLDGKLYGYHGEQEIDDDRSLDEMLGDARRFGKFNFLMNWGEQFDACKSFLFNPPGNRMRVLCRLFPTATGLGTEISMTGLLSASTAFVHWFESHEAQLKLLSE